MRIHSLILGENFYEQKRDMAPRGGQTCGTPPPLLGSLNATLAFSDALINCAEHFRGEAWGAGDEGLARAGGKLGALPSAQTVIDVWWLLKKGGGKATWRRLNPKP